MDGWQRLWILTKWLASIPVALWAVSEFAEALPNTPAGPSLEPGQVLIGMIFVALVAGGAVFGFLSALEWVYRGFRPLPDAPATEATTVKTPQPAETDALLLAPPDAGKKEM